MELFLIVILILTIVILIIKDERSPVDLQVECLLDTCHEQESIIESQQRELDALRKRGVA